MNTHRYTTPPKRVRPPRAKGNSSLFWGGAMVVIGLIAGVLYCLLTNRVPV
jgi:hypothetical protein